ncbi:thioredoxin, mitochondrial [Alligator sinensis]|uniref:Thioredoxin, mitochondrial n=1 Tax=Alligator sinensis TaxID=38654 RepID=A0A1U8D5B9_ALLSI|nr:thioredoxin, mitochondrial [Alligator sinensis]
MSVTCIRGRELQAVRQGLKVRLQKRPAFPSSQSAPNIPPHTQKRAKQHPDVAHQRSSPANQRSGGARGAFGSFRCHEPISSQYLPARAADRSLPQPTPCPHSSSPANEVAACPGSARELRRPPGPGRSTFNVQDGEDFQDRVINSTKPVVIDFHAQWCGPCKILGPRLEKMVAKQQGKVLMAKVDIDDHTDLAIEYEVSAVPTVLAMKNGDVVDKFVGIKDEDQLEAFLKKLIGA